MKARAAYRSNLSYSTILTEGGGKRQEQRQGLPSATRPRLVEARCLGFLSFAHSRAATIRIDAQGFLPMSKVFLHTRSPGKHDWTNEFREFARIPIVGEY